MSKEVLPVMNRRIHNKKFFAIVALSLFFYIVTCIATYDRVYKLPVLSEEAEEVFDYGEKEATIFSPDRAVKNILKSDELGEVTNSLKNIKEPDLNSRNAIILDKNTNRILYEKDANTQVAMASTTKVMTFLVVAELCNLDEETTVSRESAAIGGSSMHLKRGEVITVEALLYGMLMSSGNDAAGALAEHAAGSIEDFCKLMNEKARILGAYNTHFTSPHGLDNDEHFTTAYDLALITKAAVQDPLFIEIISTKQLTISGHNLTNTNPLLGQIPYVVGGKTGYTSNAGRCLVLYVKSDDVSAIVVLLGSSSSEKRISDAVSCVSYVTSAYKTYTIPSGGRTAFEIVVKKGITNKVNCVCRQDITLTLRADDYLYAEYTVLYRFDGTLTAPVSTSTVLMEIYVYSNDTLLGILKCTPSSSVARKSYTDHLGDVLETFPDVFT